ncbi:MAG: helix-turn-helix transcriptional regulator, partial [Clostridia bacterium]|nr:helix-turn-helix transcriptional regulator [Clostridia bacterium]
ARFEEYGYLRSSDTPADAVKEREQTFIRAVVAYTDRRFMEDLHTADTARELGYSEAYFCRLFRELFRMRYADYLCNQRITYAKVLLQSKTVTETALACGFSSISYFSSVFRRLTGMTPTEYQKNQLG